MKTVYKYIESPRGLKGELYVPGEKVEDFRDIRSSAPRLMSWATSANRT